MYAREKQRMEINKKKYENMKEQIEKEHKEEIYTFKPKISQKSRELAKSKSNNNIKIEDRLLKNHKINEKNRLQKLVDKSYDYQEKYLKKKNNYLNFDTNEENNLTFTPIINKTKRKNLINNENIFEKLYKNVNKTKDKIEEQFNKIYTFKPEINDKSKKLIKNSRETKNEYINRISHIKNNLKENEEKFKKIYDLTFHPKINEIPEYLKNKQKNNIENNKEKKEDKKILNNNNQLKNYEKKKKQWIKHANEIVNDLKKQKYKEIFNFLVQNNEEISYQNLENINENDLSNKLNSIIKEIKDKKIINMNFDKFSKLADKYFTKSK